MATITPDTKEEQDEAYSPQGRSARELNDAENFDALTSPENMDKNGVSGDLSGGARKAEESGGYRNNFTGAQNQSIKSSKGIPFIRRKGPLAIILTILLGGGIGFSALFTPGILIVQMKEVMVDRFNTQLPSMNVRTTKLISAKIDNTTGGVCTVVNIRCKYTTVSDKQVQKFRAAGIEISPVNAGNRIKPVSFTFNGGDPISAREFSSKMKTDPAFRAAVKNAYNPKYAGFSDSKWTKFAQRYKLTKRQNISGADDTKRTENLNNTVKNGETATPRVVAIGNNIDPACTENCDTYTDQDQVDKVNDFNESARAGTKPGAAAVSAIEEGVQSGSAAVGNIVKLTGVADTACQAYGAVQTVGYAAKTVRAVQLARYAMVFLNTADLIKSGDAKPEDVAYAGTILTSLAYDAKSASRGSATDSFGYKYAAYGDTGKMNNFSSQFLAGGGLTGDLISVTSTIRSFIPGPVRETCSTLANPWVQAGSLAGGLALMLIPTGVGQAGMIAKLATQAALQASLSVALIVLPELLKDIVAGTTTDGIVGADSGDAFASGSGGLMGGVANIGGNAPMSKEDALAYNNLQSDTLALYSADEASQLSPLDATNRNTFLGSIVFSLLPSVSSNQAIIGGGLSTIGSILSTSVSKIVPSAGAITTQQYSDSLDVCQDIDYVELGIATDPFCNVIYGIPPKYLDKDPLVVLDELAGQIDDITGEPIGEYATFVQNCIERTEPLGNGGPTLDPKKDGSNCKINDSNANYYLHVIDQRVNVGMEE